MALSLMRKSQDSQDLFIRQLFIQLSNVHKIFLVIHVIVHIIKAVFLFVRIWHHCQYQSKRVLALTVACCPAQAIFLVEEHEDEDYGLVTFPYEFLPLPEVGDLGWALGRNGKALCEAEITQVRAPKSYDHTALVTMKVPYRYIDKARFYQKGDE